MLYFCCHFPNIYTNIAFSPFLPTLIYVSFKLIIFVTLILSFTTFSSSSLHELSNLFFLLRWIIFLDGPLLDSTSDYGKGNILFKLFLYFLAENFPSTLPLFYLHQNSTIRGTPPTSNMQKNTTTMVEPFAGSSGVAMTNQLRPLQ
jgi:hypothetical protein